ncbi:MAG: hypothetical protein AAFQ52_16370 [Chloroflexota bacterium]
MSDSHPTSEQLNTTEHISYNTPSSGKLARWRCSHCGQLLFSTSELALPAKCNICKSRAPWEAYTDTVTRWRCPNCGQTLFTTPDDKPPDMCHYCQDMTTWEKS